MIGLCLGAVVVDAASRPSVTPITLAVVAPRDVSDSLVNRICTEAEAIWGPTGIAFEWDRHESTTRAGRWTIEVTIDDRHAPDGRDGALGWVLFTTEGAESSLHLSRASAEALLRNTPGMSAPTIFSHEALIGRALGRALAHEFGHYIFQSGVHTLRGLMRAGLTSDEIFRLDRDGFELTSQERATAAGRLWIALSLNSNAPRV